MEYWMRKLAAAALPFHPFANSEDMRKAKAESRDMLRKVFEQAL